MAEICWTMTFLLLLHYVMLSQQQAQEQESLFYHLSARDINTNKDVTFGNYRGKVVLVVNVASECGYTDSNYRQLVQMHNKYKARGLEILGFPCNQFGKQEPKKNKYVMKYVLENYAVPFSMFGKIHTVGENQHALYRWLKESTGVEPTWNFCKYLLDHQGRVVRFASAWIPPVELEGDVETLLQGGVVRGGVLYHDQKIAQREL